MKFKKNANFTALTYIFLIGNIVFQPKYGIVNL